jgi:hypothetical protein
MSDYGDDILRIFHKNNFTYSPQMTLDKLMDIVN